MFFFFSIFQKINVSPPKKKKVESDDSDEEKIVPQRTRRTRAPIKYSFSDSEEEQEKGGSKDDSWDLRDSDFE